MPGLSVFMTRAIGHFLLYWKKETFMQKGPCRMPKKQKNFCPCYFERTADAACGLGNEANSRLWPSQMKRNTKKWSRRMWPTSISASMIAPTARNFVRYWKRNSLETGQIAYYYNTKKRVNDANYDEVLDTYGVEFVPLLIKLENGKAVGSSIWTPLQTCRHYWRQNNRRECPRLSDNHK